MSMKCCTNFSRIRIFMAGCYKTGDGSVSCNDLRFARKTENRTLVLPLILCGYLAALLPICVLLCKRAE